MEGVQQSEVLASQEKTIMQIIQVSALQLETSFFPTHPKSNRLQFDMGKIFFWETSIVTILILSKGEYIN